MHEEEEEKKAEFETRWRCWKCDRIYQMDDYCAKCKIQVSDYEG